MYYRSVDLMEVRRCLLCHDAPCTGACPRADPARILWAVRFQNGQGPGPCGHGGRRGAATKNT